MASGICARHHPHHALSTGIEFSAGNHNLSPENRSKLQPWNRRRNQSLPSHHRNSLKLAGIHGRSLTAGALETPVPRSSYHYNHHHGIRHNHRRTTTSATQYSPETALSNHRFHSDSLPKLTVVNRSQQALSVSSMASLVNTVYSFKLSHNAAEAFGSRRNRRLAAKSRCVTFNRRRLVVRAAETDTNEVKAKVPDKAPADNGSSINQILGIKGAKQETDKLKIRVQLMKPVTWPPLIWGVVCGAAASGNFHWTVEDVAKSIVCMLMSGPCLTGYTQTINDWYDREIDAINEPYRPIPSGAIAEDEVITQIWVLLLAGLGLAGLLDVWAGHDFPVIFYLAVGGSLLSYIYSAPPLKLKQNGWIGNFALGASYISLPWWAGQALFGTLTPDIVVLTLLYSIAGLGIAIVNDFKSIEGDRKMGLQSLPVAFGLENAKWICVGAIDITQLSVAGYLLSVGKTYYALALLGLIAPQVFFQFKYFLKDPVKYDVKYQASAQPFLILGLLVTALATSH